MYEKGKFALKVLLNVVIAGIIYSIATSIIGNFAAGGVILSSIISLAILLFAVPYVFEKHPGDEAQQLWEILLALPVGLVLVGVLNAMFGVTLPALTFNGFALGSLQLVYAFTAYIIADTITLQFIK